MQLEKWTRTGEVTAGLIYYSDMFEPCLINKHFLRDCSVPGTV